MARIKPIIKWGKMGMPTHTFQYHDGGKLRSKCPKQDNDCAVRALALAFSISYDEAHTFLMRHGRKYNDGYHIFTLLNDYANRQNPIFNCQLTKIPFPSKRGQQRMYVAAFCALYPSGIYLLRLTQHITTCFDGVIHDTWWDPRNVVFSAYKIERL